MGLRDGPLCQCQRLSGGGLRVIPFLRRECGTGIFQGRLGGHPAIAEFARLGLGAYGLGKRVHRTTQPDAPETPLQMPVSNCPTGASWSLRAKSAKFWTCAARLQGLPRWVSFRRSCSVLAGAPWSECSLSDGCAAGSDRICVIVNEMLEQLAMHVQALGEVGENIAHDLRTPLTALRVPQERAERLAGGETEAGHAVSNCLGNVGQALSTITAMLRIADIQRGTRVSAFQLGDLGAIVRETTEIFQPIAEDRGINLVPNLAGSSTVLGDCALLVEALVNLVDNALKFMPRVDRVDVGVQGTKARPERFVGDNGPGIDPALRTQANAASCGSLPAARRPAAG